MQNIFPIIIMYFISQNEISTIESLLGSTDVKVLFGMLTQPEEGAWYLEDLVSLIKLGLYYNKYLYNRYINDRYIYQMCHKIVAHVYI